MADLEILTAVHTGIDAAGDEADVDGDSFLNTGRELLIVHNAGEDPIAVTVESTYEVDEQDVADLVVAVPAGESRHIGPLRPGIYNDEDGLVQVTYDVVTDVSVAVLHVARA